MPIDSHLLSNEKILVSAKAQEDNWGRGGTLYATNKRIIRYNKDVFGEKMDSLQFSHIVGASYENQSLIWLTIIGIIFTPVDIAYTAHWIFVFIGYPSIFLMGAFYSLAVLLSDKFSKTYAILIAVLTIIFLISILVGLVGIVISRTIMVIGQKLARLALAIEYIVLIYGSWKLE